MNKIILPGALNYKKKFSFSRFITTVFFIIIPIILIIVSVVMLFIHLSRLNSNIIVKAYELIRDIFKTRTGWFFKSGETFQSVYRDYPLEYAMRMIPTAIVLFLGNFIASFQCPYCGHFFTLHRISADRYEGSSERNVSNTYYENSDGITFSSGGSTHYTLFSTKKSQSGVETTDYYSHNEKCSCCGCVSKRETSRTETSWD